MKEIRRLNMTELLVVEYKAIALFLPGQKVGYA